MQSFLPIQSLQSSNLYQAEKFLLVVELTVFDLFPEATVLVELGIDPHPGGRSCLKIEAVGRSVEKSY